MKSCTHRRQGFFRALARCMKDERAQALTEYAVLMAVVAAMCFYLYYPDNGFYEAMRTRYDLTTLMLSMPGP